MTEGFMIGVWLRELRPEWRYEQDGRLYGLIMPDRYYELPRFTGVTFPA
jgi:hypothetical protein